MTKWHLFENKGTIGIYCGRFQPPHKSHLKIIQEASKENSKVYVFVVAGSKSSQDREKNPIPQQERINLLISIVPSNVIVLGAHNAYIPDLVKNLGIEYSTIKIYGGPDRVEYNRFVKNLPNAFLVTKNFGRDSISSSKVRNYMKMNEFDLAQKLLPYSIDKIKRWFI